MKKEMIESKGKLTIANKDGDVVSGELTPKQKLEALIEAYKKQNPNKYKIKKDELKKQLNLIK